MSYTVGDLVSLLSAFVAVIAAIQAGRRLRSEAAKSGAEARSIEADTAAKYQELADKCAEAQGALQLQIDELRKAIFHRDALVDELRRQVASRDARIVELERLTDEQASEIAELRAHVARLERKRKAA